MSDVTQWLWRFVRGDMSVEDFEPSIYENLPLEEALGAERYLDLISASFNDPEQVDRIRENLREFLFSASSLRCLCLTLPDLAVLDMGEHEETFATLQLRRSRGQPFWWLSAYVCANCHQGWLVAQEERHNDIFCLRRLSDDQVTAILNRNDWPTEFDRFETLLQIGFDCGRSVRFADPHGDSSLHYTIAALARDRPGISISELCKLLNIDRTVAEQIAKAVLAGENVHINFDSREG